MDSSQRYRKRELSPLQRARVSLGLSVDARPKTNFAWVLRQAGLSATGIEYLRFSEDEPAQRVVALYDSLNRTEKRASTLDYLIMAAKVDAHRVWGALHAELGRITDSKTLLLACLRAPDVVEQTIQRALTPEGFQDRRLLLQTARMLAL